MSNVHVGVQLRPGLVDLVRADDAEARCELEVDVMRPTEVSTSVARPVQGRRSDRFVYPTWGEVHAGGGFEMFRRAKLMLNRIDLGLVHQALDATGLTARIDLTGGGRRLTLRQPEHQGQGLGRGLPAV